MIFYRRGARGVNKKTGEDIPYGLEDKINFAVFPGMTGVAAGRPASQYPFIACVHRDVAIAARCCCFLEPLV
jgi:hypothetical protein